MKKDYFPACSHPNSDCVKNHAGHCCALYDATFNRPCPFYMNAATKTRMIRECADRLKKVGWVYSKKDKHI